MTNKLTSASYSITLCQTIIKNLLHISYPGIKVTSHLIGIPVRTLQRQLKKSGISYSQLVKQTRLKVACHLISNSESKVKEIA